MTPFTGLRVIVTGGAAGIGLRTARRLTEAGALVGILDRTESHETDVASARADITDDVAVRSAVATLSQVLGGVDVVVNNAGIGAIGGVEDNDDDEWAHVLGTNVTGLVRVSRAALPALRESDRAAIVNVASVAATVGLPRRALYSASKGAVLSLSLAMATDLLADGIRVNAVLPGTADTPWIGNLLAAADDPPAERAALEARQPHSRLVHPDEVADAICYLASPASGSTTGTWLTVDGGLTRLRPRPGPR